MIYKTLILAFEANYNTTFFCNKNALFLLLCNKVQMIVNLSKLPQTQLSIF